MQEPFASLPSLRPMPRRPPQEVLRIAHRGGASGQEDYSVPNLATIADQGIHLLEFDVHVTRDDELVVNHNPVITREATGPWWIGDHTLGELQALPPADQVPSAAAVVGAARQAGLGLYADIKTLSPAGAVRLVELLHDEGMTDRVILASARSDIVAQCAEAAPELPRSVLFSSTQEEPVQLAASVRADFVHPCWELWPDPHRLLAGPWLDRVRANELGVICWHEERPDIAVALYELGVDGICTDEPELLRRIAATR